MKFGNENAVIWLIATSGVLISGIFLGLMINLNSDKVGIISNFVTAVGTWGILITAIFSYQNWRNQKVTEAQREDASAALAHLLLIIPHRHKLAIPESTKKRIDSLLFGLKTAPDELTQPEKIVGDAIHDVNKSLEEVIEDISSKVNSAISCSAAIEQPIIDKLASISWQIHCCKQFERDSIDDNTYFTELVSAEVNAPLSKQFITTTSTFYLTKYSSLDRLSEVINDIQDVIATLRKIARYEAT
ncbi:hypothetical protein [Pseudidiomarina andamanensis]|uniref:Uncharacterized protein n=1 Tax=Pseudidiomarina andamanensis TaxID=1940690 RepID=A0AA92ESH2_9GAMM|nr:hypothetical protein [Pseudidiomarina andamanensis]MDS0218630.1 hypothetical protein [Pseudidiomarina andamanensis]QGT95495.1 hypothetical protein D3795_04565 [Pseudidiomarina andamanensis]